MITPKLVNKPWGHERWLADGVRTPYALKEILFKAGHRSSLQVHKFKIETNYVLSGTGLLTVSKLKFPINQYLNGELGSDTLDWYLQNIEELPLESGMVFDVLPGTVHRITAITDLTFIESSTVELDDVIRLHDDTKRTHGRIETEHG